MKGPGGDAIMRPTHTRTPSGNQRVFKALTRADAETAMHMELDKLLQIVPEPKRSRTKKEFEGFKQLFRRYLENSSQQIEWEKIEALDNSKFTNYDDLPKPKKEKYKELLDQLIVVKLNGGLGTSMGCTGAKSLITVRNDCTFLDLTVQQIARLNKKYGCHIPLVLMNSFNTQEETARAINKYSQFDVKIYTFEQSKFPRIARELLLPMATVSNPSEDDLEAWYPPGHGDVYRSFVNSNLADQFSAEGKRWVFISNIDNLGATVSTSILQFLEDSSSDFVMEVTEKTRADVKGGTLVNQDGKLRLLEIAQVPKERVDEFTSVRKFRIFNTNNIWVSLQALRRQVANNTIDMEIIVNPKTLDNGLNILQLEEAVGAAIKSFERAVGLKVPRSRFLPVKTTSDLLLLMSDLYLLESGKVVVNKARNFPTVPLVKLGTHFRRVKDFLHRFGTIPNMLELDHLTVSGDVTFGNGVHLRGTVIIIANHGDRIDIPPGAILENKIVSGNLRILDH